jgi:hypothetical protein
MYKDESAVRILAYSFVIATRAARIAYAITTLLLFNNVAVVTADDPCSLPIGKMAR